MTKTQCPLRTLTPKGPSSWPLLVTLSSTLRPRNIRSWTHGRIFQSKRFPIFAILTGFISKKPVILFIHDRMLHGRHISALQIQ